MQKTIKACTVCQRAKPVTSFRPNNNRGGFYPSCRPCEAAKQKARDRLKAEVRDSDLAALDADEYLLAGTTWGGESGSQKRQEYNERMGHVAEFARDVAAGKRAKNAPPDREALVSRYTSTLAEDERRFVNRRRARSVSLTVARDTLFVRQFEEMAARVFKGTIDPRGFATKRAAKPTKRMANLLLSDLHIGAVLPADELPEAFGFTEAGRRLARITEQTIDYKPQYRDATTLNLLLNGDLIEGLLLHDIRDGAPLTEQCLAFLQFLGDAIAHLAREFPRVEVWCQPGNHGRNKLRHEGRATSQKWDSTETVLFLALRMMSERLGNVAWHIPKTPVCVVPLFDKRMLLTHGDTALKIGSPSKHAASFEEALNKINGTRAYGEHIDLLAVGHFHEPRVMYFKGGAAIVNGALVPPNGHARTEGYDTACGQFLWESVPGHALGDVRYLSVGQTEDADAALDRIIRPVRW
jgi:hypothetical protein